jgi:hypothetical protein
MLSRLRLHSSAAIAAFALVLAACGEGTTLPTTVDPVEMEADVAALETGFEAPSTEAFIAVGYDIDAALAEASGSSVQGATLRLPAMLVAEGPIAEAPLRRLRERLIETKTDEISNAIPITLLGKTFVYDTATNKYVVNDTITGAPATGIRFRLYAIDSVGLVAEPLVQVGHVDLTRTTNGSSVTGRIEVYNIVGTKLLDYSVTVGGTAAFPTFNVSGFAGVGVNQVTFSLTTGFSLVNGAASATWTTSVPARGLMSRVRITIGGTEGDPSFTLGGVIRAGLRKVEINGAFDNEGGELTVKVGDKVFAYITITGIIPTVTDENGDPLTPEDEETLLRIFHWFETAFDAPDAILAPIFVWLDVDTESES